MTPIAEIILLVIVSAAVVVLATNLLRGRRRAERERAQQQRLRELADRAEEDAPAEQPALREKPGRVERRLLAAGFGLTPLAFGLIALVAGLLALWLLLSWLPRLPWAAVLLAALAVFLCYVLLREWGELRVRRFEGRLVDAVDHMVSALLAGQNLTQALNSAAGASTGAVRRELSRVVDLLSAGMDIRPAVAPLARAYDCEGVRLLTQTLIAKWRTGGDLGPVMQSVAAIMRERMRLRMRLWTELSAVQLVGVAIAALPYVLVPFLATLRPNWTETWITHPLGQPLLAVAVFLQFLGLAWLRRNSRVEF